MFLRFPNLPLRPLYVALLPSAISCVPLHAQTLEPGQVLSNGAQLFDSAGQVITPNNPENSTGFFLNNGNFSVSNSTFNGFQTQGGEGSGGGAGLGGVFFVNNGASLTLDNVNFIGNAAVGGTGGGGASVNFSPINVSSSSMEVSVIPTTEGTASVIIEDMMGINGNQIMLDQANPFFAEGMVISGSGIAEGTVIEEISEDGTVITLMAPMGDAIESFIVEGLTNVQGETSFTVVSADEMQALAAIGGLEVGTSLSGQGISVGTEITDIVQSEPDPMTGEITTTIEISIPTTENVEQFVGNGIGILTSSSVTTAMDNSLTLSMEVDGLMAGQSISGDGIAEGTTITSISEDGLTLGLSTALENPEEVDGFTAANQVGVAGESVITLANPNAQIQEGFLVSGPGIPAGTRILSISENEFNETEIQLSNNLTQDLANGFTVSPVVSSQVSGDTTTITVAGGTEGLSTGQLFSSPNLTGTITSVNSATGVIVVDAASTGAVDGFTSIPPTSFGGSLNGLFNGSAPAAGDNGDNASFAVAALNGGDGGDGSNGGDGSSGTGAGSAGGNGGNGSNGLPFDPIVASDLAFAVGETVLAAANLAASAIPNIGLFPAPDPGDVIFAIADTASAAANLVAAGVVFAGSQALFASGDSGRGGDGGVGGDGGDGVFGFGGGPGGNGGDGGNSGSAADGGAGGDGGNGGFGGFGAGGGSGGARGEGGSGGNSTSGAAGDGGFAGFGGGTGSNGLGIGGNGGSGFGGAIFVANGGNLTITGNALFDNNVVAAGSSLNMGSAGEAAGTDLFIAAGANVNLNPGAGNVQTFNGTIADDSVASFSSATNGEGSGGGVTISSGLVEFNGENTFTGETNLAGGVLRADDGVGINAGSRINIAGGILETSGIFDRTVGFNVGSVGFSGSGGFAALGDDLTVTLSAGIPLTVGQGAFLPLGGSLDFGSHSSDSQVEFTNDIILNGADLGLNVSRNQNEGSTALVSGVISDGNAPGGITVNGNGDLGTLFLDAENTYTGLTNIVGGTLVLTENGSLSGGSAVNIDANGIFDISAATDQTLAGLQGGGELEIGATQLSINQDNNTVFEGNINGDGGSIIKSGSGVLTLAGASAFTEGTVINAGTLALATAGSLENTGTVTVNTGAIFDTSESDQSIDGLTGSGRVNIGASALTINQEIDTIFSGAIADGGIFAGTGGQLIKNGEGELTLSGANSFTGAAQINSGVLTLIDSGAFATATVNIADNATLNNNSSGLAAIATLTNNGTVNLNADDTISILVNTGTINNDQFTLEATNGFALNDGSVINANLGSGAVTANGTVALNGTSATETFLVESGVTTLGAGERLNDSVNLTVNNSAQLTLGGDEQIGSLFGAGELATADSVLSVDDGNFDGVISGNGDVIKTSDGNLILTNNNTFTGTAQITSGTLTLIDEGALTSDSITVASSATLVNNSSGLDANATLNNDGVVNLNSDDTISTLVNTGVINNDQFTLEAADGFNLNNGSVINANLGMGTVTANGVVALNGTSATETFIVESGVTTLGAEERLNDAVDLTIADNARIILGGNERISGLLGAGELATSASRLIVDDGNFDGDISGAGNIVKISDGTLTLTNRNTFAGPAQINAGTLTLSNDASLATDTVNVAVGATLTNNSSGLADNTTLTNDGTVNLNSNDSIANLVNTGTINNDQFTLEAANGFALNNGSVINANLGDGTVTANGNVRVNGTSATETFMVQSGVTTLGASERLNDSVNLTVAESAQLVLGGDEQIGNLNGAGELATANSQLLVDSGNFDGIISGAGGVIKTSDDTLVLSNSNTFTGQALVESGVLQIVENGALATNSVTVTDSAILINESAGFADSADVTVNGLVQLTQGDWINGLSGRGDVELINDSVLSVVAGDFSGNLSGSGALTKEGNGELTLRGENTFSGVAQINSGSLILEDNASLSTETVNVSQEATLTNNSSGLSDNTRLTNSGTVVVNSDDTVAVLNNSGLLQGEGTLTAATYNLNDGTVVESNLGAGVVNTNGDVTLSGNSDAELINIGAGSVLTLAESEILNDLATVNVASMGLLSLIGGDETIQRLLGDGSLATNGNNLIVTNGGEFNGSIVGSDESNLMVTGDTLVLGGDDDTEFANVSVASGSDIELTDNVSITANDNIQVDEGGSLIIGEAANLASNLITVDGTLILADGESLDYALLNGAGSIETDAFVNNTDSTVGGNLTFTGDFTNTGVLSPGNSPGLVTIGGNFTENGNLELEVISPETGGVTADQVRVGGTITLGATSTLTLVNDADSPQTAGTVYNLLTNLSGGTRGVNGNFAQVLFDSDGLNNGQQATSNAAAVFDLDTGQAIFTGLNNADSTFRELGNSVNTGAVASALIAVSELDNGDNQIRSSQLSGNFLRTALESGNIGENLSLFAPEFFGSLADVGFQTNSQSLDLTRSRLLNPQDAGSFSGIVAVNTADFDGADSGTDGQLNSSTLGIDYVFENTLHLGGTITSFDGDLDANTGDVDVESGLTLQGFAGYSLTEKWDIFGSLVYSSQSYDIDRQTQQGIVTADTDGDSFGINLGASYDLVQVKNAKISPYAIVSSSFYSQDAFAEQGAIDALSIESYDADLYRIKTGVSVLSSYEFSNSRRLFLRADIGVSQQLSDDRDDLRASIIADSRIAFPVEVDESADAQIDVDLGAVYYFLPKHSLSFDYQGKFSDTGSNVFNLRYQIEF